MKTAEEWMDEYMDAVDDVFTTGWLRAIQRDALETACAELCTCDNNPRGERCVAWAIHDLIADLEPTK